MSERDTGDVGCARRRRERQPRACHRHGPTTLAMELATALHHSAPGPNLRVVERPVKEEVAQRLTGSEDTSSREAARHPHGA